MKQIKLKYLTISYPNIPMFAHPTNLVITILKLYIMRYVLLEHRIVH